MYSVRGNGRSSVALRAGGLGVQPLAPPPGPNGRRARRLGRPARSTVIGRVIGRHRCRGRKAVRCARWVACGAPPFRAVVLCTHRRCVKHGCETRTVRPTLSAPVTPRGTSAPRWKRLDASCHCAPVSGRSDACMPLLSASESIYSKVHVVKSHSKVSEMTPRLVSTVPLYSCCTVALVSRDTVHYRCAAVPYSTVQYRTLH